MSGENGNDRWAVNDCEWVKIWWHESEKIDRLRWVQNWKGYTKCVLCLCSYFPNVYRKTKVNGFRLLPEYIFEG